MVKEVIRFEVIKEVGNSDYRKYFNVNDEFFKNSDKE